MSASKPRNVPPPTDGARANPYARFIPREEVSSFAAWALGDISAAPGAANAPRARRASDQAKAVDPAELVAQQQRAARQSGYQDGYRDGLVALEGFKQSFAAQTTAQVGALVASIGGELDALQQEMAKSLAAAATQLARRIVRSELAARPDCVTHVAEQAIDALLQSARHITVRVHPDDHVLVAAGAGETLAARGARLVADAQIARGGCKVDSDIGGVDATIEERWRRAAAALGCDDAWSDGAGPEAGGSPQAAP
ncbi:MAG TPA: FliH/SctL family protein [Caldimonas sp.]|nr:FliH/SctL family protein [Caldimonas sp.]